MSLDHSIHLKTTGRYTEFVGTFGGQKTPIRKRNAKGEEVQKKPIKRPDRGPNQPMVGGPGHPAPYKIGVGSGSFDTVKT